MISAGWLLAIVPASVLLGIWIGVVVAMRIANNMFRRGVNRAFGWW